MLATFSCCLCASHNECRLVCPCCGYWWLILDKTYEFRKHWHNSDPHNRVFCLPIPPLQERMKGSSNYEASQLKPEQHRCQGLLLYRKAAAEASGARSSIASAANSYESICIGRNSSSTEGPLDLWRYTIEERAELGLSPSSTDSVVSFTCLGSSIYQTSAGDGSVGAHVSRRLSFFSAVQACMQQVTLLPPSCQTRAALRISRSLQLIAC